MAQWARRGKRRPGWNIYGLVSLQRIEGTAQIISQIPLASDRMMETTEAAAQALMAYETVRFDNDRAKVDQVRARVAELVEAEANVVVAGE